MRKIYMAVTADRYELPFLLTDTVKEMSKITGKSAGVISCAISRKNTTKVFGQQCKLVSVAI